MFMLPLFALLRRIAESTRSLPPLFPSPEISSFWGTSTTITPSGTHNVLLTPAGRKYLNGLSLRTSFSSMILTPQHFSIAFKAVAILLISPLLPLLLHWEVPQDLGSDRLLILLTVTFSSLFLPNKRSPSYSFQKPRWNKFVLLL